MVETVASHTCELKPSQEDAAQVANRLRRSGWEVYNERVPLSAQFGYYCVRVVPQPNGTLIRYAHSVRWNLFEHPLEPVTIDCPDEGTLLSFLWGHSSHENFSFFEYEEGDVGFVCYCRGLSGYSLALRLNEDCELSDTARDVVTHCIARAHSDD